MTGLDDRILARIAAESPDGLLGQVDGQWVLTMTRTFPRPPAQVWPWLTDRDRLLRWSPLAPAGRDLDGVGPATSQESPDAPPVAADVLVHDPPRELVHRWHDHLLRWTLEPDGAGTRLQLEHTFSKRPDASKFAAGWHVCFAGLANQVDGIEVERPVAERSLDYGWAALRDRYDERWNA